MLTDVDMCRCCGQITDTLKNMNEHCLQTSNLKLIEWFLTFTNLNKDNFCEKYTSICDICELKLRQAHEFREECLMCEMVFSQEANAIDNEADLSADYDTLELNEDNHDVPKNAVQTPVVETQNSLRPDGPSCKTDHSLSITKKQQKSSTSKIEGTKNAVIKKALLLCGVCGATFFQDHQLKIHSIAHSNERPFSCSICLKTFKSKMYLKRHMRFHAPTKKFECEICHKKFQGQPELTLHKTSHFEEQKKYPCMLCEKKFATKTYLKHHLNIHTNTFPYECSKCEKKFRRVHAFNTHFRREHENIRFPCQDCSIEFRHSSGLKFHILLKHQGAKLICDVCSMEFTYKKAIVQHLKKYHNSGFNQSVHFVLPTNERIIRSIKLQCSIIQTEKQEP